MSALTAWESPTPEVEQHVRAVAERLREDLDDVVRAAGDAILAGAPELAADPVLASLTRASTSANIRRWVLQTVEHPERPVGGDTPPEAMDLARDVVRRGMDYGALQAAYRTGQNVLWGYWMDSARDAELDGAELVAVLDIASRSIFGFVDGILNRLNRLMEHERDELTGGGLSRQRETAALILDGAPIAEARASVRLGHELSRSHTAVILWSEDGAAEHGELEDAARLLAQHLGALRPLTLPSGRSAVWAWISGVEPEPAAMTGALASLPEAIRATAGTTAPGIAGFRDSHLQARAAQRLLIESRAAPRQATYADVEVVALAAHDRPGAAAFVAATLGDLASADAELRETVRVYLHEDNSASRAAELLFTHRNTVLKRVARADALLPRPLKGRGLEVRLALELQRWGVAGDAGR